MKWLALRKVIPRSTDNVVKPPPGVAIIFAAAHKRAWKTKRGSSKHIDKGHVSPGYETSFDRVIYKKAGLIPQVTGNLKSRRFLGSTMIFDQSNRHIHKSMFEGATDVESAWGIQEHDHTLKRYDQLFARVELTMDDLIKKNYNVVVKKGINSSRMEGKDLIIRIDQEMLTSKRRWVLLELSCCALRGVGGLNYDNLV